MSWQPPPGPPPDPNFGPPESGQWQHTAGPTPWPQQSPPPRKHRTLVIVLVVIVFVIVASIGSCVFLIGRAVGGSRAYFNAGNEYLSALEDGDAAGAYALLCPAVQARVTSEAFAQAVADVDRIDEHNLNAFSTTTGNGITRTEVSGTVGAGTLSDLPVTLEFEGEPLVCGARADDPRVEAAVWPVGAVRR